MKQCFPDELHEKRDRGDDFVLLDVRNNDELTFARLDPCVHIPLHEIEARVHELALYADNEIVVLCHAGLRSAMAQQFLEARGFANVRNLMGGIDAYAAEIEPELARY
ncbi:MAG: rhodanese-like domain-containing protein [Candidatus Hydrogenedentota bacterium]